ncbi:unnamed protein product [Closterium sp. Naga37s-1]|nr:unnamed protein product [Closterium sp. Naga37s-1]
MSSPLYPHAHQAEYLPASAAAADGIGAHHYGLAVDLYSHFTSPIRRYADLLMHWQFPLKADLTLHSASLSPPILPSPPSSLYSHFTSPIRRYADLLVHRQLLAALQQGKRDRGEAGGKQGGRDSGPSEQQHCLAKLASKRNLAAHLNKQHRLAKMASKRSAELCLLLLLRDQPLVERAVVSRRGWGGRFLGGGGEEEGGYFHCQPLLLLLRDQPFVERTVVRKGGEEHGRGGWYGGGKGLALLPSSAEGGDLHTDWETEQAEQQQFRHRLRVRVETSNSRRVARENLGVTAGAAAAAAAGDGDEEVEEEGMEGEEGEEEGREGQSGMDVDAPACVKIVDFQQGFSVVEYWLFQTLWVQLLHRSLPHPQDGDTGSIDPTL